MESDMAWLLPQRYGFRRQGRVLDAPVPEEPMIRPMPASEPRIKLRSFFAALSLSVLTIAGPARAFNYVADANGTWWGVQDADLPVVDTGSIRATQVSPGQAGGFSTSINGFGGIKVLVSMEDETGFEPQLRFNGEMMRGFGLKFDGVNRFTTTQSVNLGGIRISRSVFINNGANWGRWLDSFTNTTKSPLKIKVAFGGSRASARQAAGRARSSIRRAATRSSLQPTPGWKSPRRSRARRWSAALR